MTPERDCFSPPWRCSVGDRLGDPAMARPPVVADSVATALMVCSMPTTAWTLSRDGCHPVAALGWGPRGDLSRPDVVRT